MPLEPLSSNQLKHKQLSEEDSNDEQLNELSSNDDEQPIPTPLSKPIPKHSSPSSSSTPLIGSSTSTSINTTNTTMNTSNAGSSDGSSDGGNVSKINLFQEMNLINSQLITLDDHFSISADYKYFIDHHEMLDEFNENVLHFLWKVNRQRKRVAFERLSTDTLFHILQFVSMLDLVKICGNVSKMWRQQVLRKELKVELDCGTDLFSLEPSDRHLKAESLLKSEFIGRVVSLRVIDASTKVFEILAPNSNSLSKLQHLDLEEFGLVQRVKFLIQLGSSCENLTSLNLSKVHPSKKEALDILSSKLLANCKMLKFSNKFNKMLKYLAGISQLSQLTHLELNQEGNDGVDDGLEEFLQSKVNLQYLSLQKHNLQLAPNLFTINSTSNLNSNTVIFNHLTKLDISYCNLPNQMLFNIILSPKLPKLETLIATNIKQRDQINTSNNSTHSIGGVVGYSSNLTELNMNNSFVHPVAEMIKFTPKLKKLLIQDLRNTNDDEIVQDYSFLAHTDSKLSQLEYLEITRSTGWIELVFTNSMFSNLKYLNCRTQWKETGIHYIDREAIIIEKCVNLPKLERVSKETITEGGISQKKGVKLLQAFRNNPMFNQLKIEHFSYECVYPNVEMNKDNDRISINL